MNAWTRGAMLVAAGALGAALAQRRARDEMDLQDAVAVVIGGSRGLGLLLARELAREGARVVICVRDAGSSSAPGRGSPVTARSRLRSSATCPTPPPSSGW